MADELKKVIAIDLNLTETNVLKNEPYQTNETFWTSDINSAYLEFTTNTEITSGSASLVLKNVDDGSVVQRNIEVTESPFYYMLREVEVVRAGRWYGQIVANIEGKALTATVFRFKIQGSLLDTTNPALFDVENYNKLSSQLMTLYDQFNGYLDDVELSEEKRELAESIRESLFKNSQEARKQAFQLSEDERTVSFDTSQSEKKNTFMQSQTDRTEAFLQKESERDDTFEVNESVREQNETLRSNIEESRNTAEIDRNLAEGVREEAEIQRVTGENSRNQNETTREQTFGTYNGRIIKLESDMLKKANSQQATWITPTLLNGWVIFETAPAFRLNTLGEIVMKGNIKNGISGTEVFKLPAGYRPPSSVYQPLYALGNVDAGIVITQAGSVLVYSNNTNRVSIDNVRF